MDFKIIGFTLGVLLVILGVAELIPAWLEFSYQSAEAGNFFINALFCLFFGSCLILANKSFTREINVRQTFMLTTLSWFMLSAVAALPLYFSTMDISFTDAFFESMSGITTTGSTVLERLDSLPYGILLWRSIMQWIGGIGLIAFAIILLPFLRVGGMQLFQTESSDISDKTMPKSASLMRHLILVYVVITMLCALCYLELGMNLFDAINHAMTTVSTGGYSTHDASFGFFERVDIQLVATFFMILGGLPFILYVQWAYEKRFEFFKDEQVLLFLKLIALLTVLLTAWVWNNTDYSFVRSFTYSIFNIVSVMTTTGFATTDYTAWGPFSVVFFFFLTYIGACAGSTSGGLKMMRLSITSKAMGHQISKLVHPRGVFTLRYQGQVIDQNIVIIILGFCGLYFALNAFLAIALGMIGLDFETAISAAATSIANVGPGIGDTIGPAGNFSSLPDAAKWLLCFGMLIGRLEILTVLVIFTPNCWRF